ncbi:MAG: hypothetical protein MJ250_09165 [Alphaproteobacteria bacterium]|nr:hypothetical protein [Alphaproteobacteria bacterium]
MEKVFLKNGSEINGVIVEQKPNETIKIKTTDGSLLVYDSKDVVKIEKTNSKKSKESVFLKNGSVVKGFITEQTVDKLKVQTSDGSLFVYGLDEIDKISKDQSNFEETKFEETKFEEEFYLPRKYRGFVDGLFGISKYNRFSVSTSHGRQVTNLLFLGGGYAMDFNFNVDRRYEDYSGYSYNYPYYSAYSKVTYKEQMCFVIAIFADARVDFIKRKWSPYIDVRMGIDYFSDVSFYSRITAGMRVKRFNLFIGTEIENLGGAERLNYVIPNERLSAFCIGMGIDVGKRNKID